MSAYPRALAYFCKQKNLQLKSQCPITSNVVQGRPGHSLPPPADPNLPGSAPLQLAGAGSSPAMRTNFPVASEDVDSPDFTKDLAVFFFIPHLGVLGFLPARFLI